MSVRAGQAKLRKLANQLVHNKELPAVDKKFLVQALSDIADSKDAETALGVKAKKGERKNKYVRIRKFNLDLAFGWLATAIAPKSEKGLGLTLKDAVTKITTEWPKLHSEPTLRRYWNNVRKTQKREFEINAD